MKSLGIDGKCVHGNPTATRQCNNMEEGNQQLAPSIHTQILKLLLVVAQDTSTNYFFVLCRKGNVINVLLRVFRCMLENSSRQKRLQGDLSQSESLASSISGIVSEAVACVWHLQEGGGGESVLGDEIHLLAAGGCWVWDKLPLPRGSSSLEGGWVRWGSQESVGAATSGSGQHIGWHRETVLGNGGEFPVESGNLSCTNLSCGSESDQVVITVGISSRGNSVSVAWGIEWDDLIDSSVGADQWAWTW